MQGAEPFFMRGGDVGCLCLHGLAASPAEVRWLGDYLAGRNLTVYGVRIAGHGTDPTDLRHVRWQEWYASALDGYHVLRSQCTQVYIAGLSMGGLLGLTLAANVRVDGMIALAAPVKFETPPVFSMGRLRSMARYLKHVMPYYDGSDTSDLPQRIVAEQVERGEPALGRVRYDQWATRSIEALNNLMHVTDSQLSNVTAPTLLVYSEADPSVPYFNLQYVAERLGSAVIETHTLKQSGHILTQDREKDTVFQLTGDFIKRLATNTTKGDA
jgi:carboxylesterase